LLSLAEAVVVEVQRLTPLAAVVQAGLFTTVLMPYQPEVQFPLP
jgi:hypothetical protein